MVKERRWEIVEEEGVVVGDNVKFIVFNLIFKRK